MPTPKSMIQLAWLPCACVLLSWPGQTWADAALPLTATAQGAPPAVASPRLELLAPVGPGSAGFQEPMLVHAPALVVSASGEGALSSRNQVRLAPDQLRAQAPLSIEEALATLPGAAVQSRGALGIQNDLALNGSTFSQTLLLLDDLPLRDPQTGHHRLDLPLPPCELEAVDLLPGDASSRFGSDAFGGTINLQTRPAGSGRGELGLWGGSFGTYGGQARLPFALGPFNQTLAFHRLHTDGFRPDTGADLLQAAYALADSQAAVPWKARLGYADKNFGANGFYAPFPSWEHTRTAFASAQASYELTPSLRLMPQGSFRLHDDDFILDVYRPAFYANHHVSRVSSLEIPALWSLPGGALMRLGLEGCLENLDSSNLGQRARNVGSAYAFFQSGIWAGLALDAGLRLDAWDSGQQAWSPSLGAVYALPAHWQLRASAGQAFRLPDFTELYYRDPGNLGNPNLAPEKAWVYEAGLDGRPVPDVLAQLTVFQRQAYDVIDWTRATAAEPWRAANLSRVNVSGVTAAAAWSRAGWSARADASWLVLASDRDAALQSKYQFNFPVRRFQVQAGYAGWLVQPWLHAAYVERVQAAGIWLLDVTLRWQVWNQTEVFVKGTNCFNSGYEDLPGVPQPGRWLLGGMDITLP